MLKAKKSSSLRAIGADQPNKQKNNLIRHDSLLKSSLKTDTFRSLIKYRTLMTEKYLFLSSILIMKNKGHIYDVLILIDFRFLKQI